MKDRLFAALQEIEDEAFGKTMLQPGAAYALGCICMAVDAQPGWGMRQVADALRNDRVEDQQEGAAS